MSKDIFECARTNDVLGLTRVLETGVDVNSRTRNNETPLHFACIARAYEAAVALIASGADVRIKTRHFLETPLHFAVQEGHIPTITLLLDAGAEPNARNCDGEGPIFSAIRWDQPEVIPLLAQRGCNINAINKQKLTPLAVAVNFESPGLVKALLACDAKREVSGVTDEQLDMYAEHEEGKAPKVSGPEILTRPMSANNAVRNRRNVRNAGEANAWFDMVANNQAEKLKEAIEQGMDVNAKVPLTEESLLHTAVTYGASECVQLLLKAGADVNAQTGLYGETPLHIAIQEGFFDIFHALVRGGADIERPTCEGEGPLFTAVKYNRIEMFRVLVRKGANVNVVDFGGLCPIHFAVMDANEFLVESLLWHDADPTKGDLNPYMYAFRAGEAQVANDLQIAAPILATATKLPRGIFQVIKRDETASLNRMLIRGFDLNLIDVLEGSPLHSSIEHHAMGCMKMLIENGANVNIRDIQRMETPIMAAIRTGNKDAYKYLLEQNPDFHFVDKDGENALFYAVRKGDTEALLECLKQGVGVDDMNHNGLTALYVAVSLKKKDIVSILLEHNANPQVEVHQSVQLASEMKEREISGMLNRSGRVHVNVKAVRSDARKVRQGRGRRARMAAEAEEIKPKKDHKPGMCHICERHKATQKLIPCGHIVSCRGCIKNFIEDHLPCPECNLKFYATATVEEELPKHE